MTPREVVEVVEHVSWVMGQSQMDLAEVLSRHATYARAHAGPLVDAQAVGQALAEAPLSLSLPPHKVAFLWAMLSRSPAHADSMSPFHPHSHSLHAATSRAHADALSHERSDVRTHAGARALAELGGSVETGGLAREGGLKSVGQCLGVEVVARRLVGDKWESVEQVVQVLHVRLAARGTTLLQVLRQHVSHRGGSGHIAFDDFSYSLGVGGRGGSELSAARLEVLWLHAASHLLPTAALDAALFGAARGKGGGAEGAVVLDICDVAMRLDSPHVCTHVLLEQAHAAQPNESHTPDTQALTLQLQQAQHSSASHSVTLQHNRQCMAIAVRRLRTLDLYVQELREQLASAHASLAADDSQRRRLLAAGGITGAKDTGLFVGLLGPILEGGRVGTPRQARGTLSLYQQGTSVSHNVSPPPSLLPLASWPCMPPATYTPTRSAHASVVWCCTRKSARLAACARSYKSVGVWISHGMSHTSHGMRVHHMGCRIYHMGCHIHHMGVAAELVYSA